MRQKLGTIIDKSKTENRTIVESNFGDSVSIVDGITFGVINGKSFHSNRRDWKREDKNNWAYANAIFFEKLAKNLKDFAMANEMESGDKL
jgi:hypothetical protein